MENNKIEFWGPLDVSSRTLADIAPNFEDLWVKAQFRMTPEQAERMEGYLKVSSDAIKSMKDTLKRFNVLNKKVDEINL